MSKLKTVPHQSHAKGPKSLRSISEIRRLSLNVHTHSYFFPFFCYSADRGCFFPSLTCKIIVLTRTEQMKAYLAGSYEYNRGQTSVFQKKK